jgi:hypothetical protein
VKTHFYHIWVQGKILREKHELKALHDLLDDVGTISSTCLGHSFIQISYESLFIRNRSIIWGSRKNRLSSFRLIISFTTNVVTVGIKVLKLCFTSEFEISRGADLEHFRKVFPTLLHLLQLDTSVNASSPHFIEQLQDMYYITRTCL